MTKPKIWLSSPHMGGNEQHYVKEAFDTNWIAPLGPNVSGFEQDLERYLGGQCHVAALSSGTAAIHLGLLLLGVQAGDEVLCQSMTFSASANPRTALAQSIPSITGMLMSSNKISKSSFSIASNTCWPFFTEWISKFWNSKIFLARF